MRPLHGLQIFWQFSDNIDEWLNSGTTEIGVAHQ
jgi:hypothetical protein